MTLPIMSLGAVGVISVAGNACPGFMALLVKECLREDYVAAAKVHYQILDFVNALFMDGSPAGIKAALNIMGFCENVLRLPLVPVNNDVYGIIKERITKLLEE
jgi:4-hydroxy-tetrahydrodipicolinate synthase